MDLGRFYEVAHRYTPQRYRGADSFETAHKLTRLAIKLALVAGLYIVILYLPILRFSGHGGQSLSDVLWYAVVGGMDRGYWLAVAPARYIGAVGTCLLLCVALATHIAGIAFSDHRRTFGAGVTVSVCLIALLPLIRPLAAGTLDAMAYGLPIAVLYLAVIMGYEGYNARFMGNVGRISSRLSNFNRTDSAGRKP